MKISFKVAGNDELMTPCIFGVKVKFRGPVKKPMIIRVGSHLCRKCEHFEYPVGKRGYLIECGNPIGQRKEKIAALLKEIE